MLLQCCYPMGAFYARTVKTAPVPRQPKCIRRRIFSREAGLPSALPRPAFPTAAHSL